MSDRRTWDVTSAGVRIHVTEEGPTDGAPVILLHGFPEFWWSWRHQMDALAAGGFRAIAPDLRGFGDSDRPEEVESYGIAHALGDVQAVLDEVGGRAAIVGHDWGGAVAWAFAAFMPDAVERLCVLNAPHPNTYARVDEDLAQLQASWYMFFFQFEGVAEEALSRDGGKLLRTWFYDTASVPLPEKDIARYLELFSDPDRLRAGLAWYRANVPPASLVAAERPELPPITCPTMLLWGRDDPYLTFELGRRAGEHCSGPYALQVLADCGHWVSQERPDDVNRHLLAFLR